MLVRKYHGISMEILKKWYLASDTMPFITLETTPFPIHIPETCKYRNIKDHQCTIPLLTKIKECDFNEAQRLALNHIETDRAKIKFL